MPSGDGRSFFRIGKTLRWLDSRRANRFVVAVALTLCIVGCGSRSATSQRLSPDSAFDKLKASPLNPLLCEYVGQYGCGFLSVSSVYLGKKVESSNFLVQCGANAQGYTVMLRDRIGDGVGSGLILQMYGKSTFTNGSYTCGDLETEVVNSQLKFKAGTCALGLRFGDAEAWSQNDAPCKVTLEERDGKNAGVIDCPQLVNGNSTWSFDNPAVFKCP
ncbi:MAG: hypothetical protein ACO3A4_11660 [Silvanigrellaceae bacterium]